MHEITFSDIFEIAIFPNCKHRRTLVYAVKQIIVQELGAERLRRAANMIKGTPTSGQNKDASALKKSVTTKSIEPEANAKAQNNKSNAPTALELTKRHAMEPKEIVSVIFISFDITRSEY